MLLSVRKGVTHNFDHKTGHPNWSRPPSESSPAAPAARASVLAKEMEK